MVIGLLKVDVTSAEEILANEVQENTVTRVGHVGANNKIMMNRKSERKRVTNSVLKDYTSAELHFYLVL